MAKADIKWPSEDEDFDVKTDAKTQADESEETPSEAPATEVVDSSGDTDETPAGETDQDSEEPEQPTDTNPKPDAEPELDTGSEPESEPESKPDAEPEPTKDDGPTKEDEPEPEAPRVFNPPASSTAPSAASKAAAAIGKVKPSSLDIRFIIELILVILVIILGLWAWQLHSDNNNLNSQINKINNDPQISKIRQSQALVAKVGRLTQLPSGEVPTVASVSDAAAAKKQSPFFNSAQNGDKVLIYVKAGKAVLYRPSENKVILVAPLNLNDSSKHN